MYYHILIEFNIKSSKLERYELDKTDKESVINEIIIPYLMKKEFQFDGYFVKQDNIDRIVIKKSEKSTKTLADHENDTVPPGLIMYVMPSDIMTYDRYTTDVTKELFLEGKKITDNLVSVDEGIEKEMKVDKTKIFIVHGHDDLAKTETARFIEKIGCEPIILHEQASSGKTIIEKIESYSNVGFAIILYTPCDLGKAIKDVDLQQRARQNVVFEHGYLMSKIGRSNVMALVKGKVETPNDISGVVYISMDKHGGWKVEIAKELRSSGYAVDMNLVL